MTDGQSSALDARAAALESASATLADPAEQELAGRLRSLLAHPAVWAELPDAAAPPRPADLPDETALPLWLADLPDEITPLPRPGDPPDGAATPPRPGDLPGETATPLRPADLPDETATVPRPSDPPDEIATPPRPGDLPGETAPPPWPAEVIVTPGVPAAADEPVESGSAQPVGLPDRARRRRPKAWVTAIGGLAAAAALALFVVVPAVVPDRETVRVQLAGTGTEQGATASATAVRLAAGWHITVRVQGLPGAPADTYYEGWVRRGDTYVPLGTFHLRQPGEVELWAGVTMTDYTSIVITRQQVGAGFAPAETVLAGNIQR